MYSRCANKNSYVVKTWGAKLSSENDVDIYTCSVRFERVEEQEPLDLASPTPSQRDEYKLYDEMVGADYRARKGDSEYSKWREFEDRKRGEKERWLQSLRLANNLFKGGLYTEEDLRSQATSSTLHFGQDGAGRSSGVITVIEWGEGR